MNITKLIEQMYSLAKEQYAEAGIDTDKVVEQIQNIAISLHCWQTDDGGGLEYEGAELSGGGIQATGNFPGKATNMAEVRQDLEKAYSLLPGNHRLNLHAIYGDFNDGFVERDQIETKHYKSWVKWAKLEEAKSKPFGAIWDYFCLKNNVPVGDDYIVEIQEYENLVLNKRS